MEESIIYITGDTHSDFSRFIEEKFPIQSEMTKDDYVIICGDSGEIWNYITESIHEKQLLDLLDSKNFTTLFVDGNHENYTRLYNYPVEEWHGWKVHKIRDSVLHLMREEIFDIDNKKIFEKVTSDGKIHMAIDNCKLMEKINENGQASQRNPMTQVYKVVEGLKEYLE